MLNKMFGVVCLVIFLASCSNSSILKDSKNSMPIEEAPTEEKEFLTEEEPQEEQEFEVINDEESANEINEKVEEEIEEVEVPDRVFFTVAQSDLSLEAKSVLDIQSEWLDSDKSINVIIEGHCDERGTREYNIALGERRALSAKNYLIAKGISLSRIKIVSYGKERPAFVGSSESVWSKNRRSVTVIEDSQ